MHRVPSADSLRYFCKLYLAPLIPDIVPLLMEHQFVAFYLIIMQILQKARYEDKNL